LNSLLLSIRQVRLLLQFGANKAAVDDAGCLPGARPQDDALPPMALLSTNSRVYPCDHRVSSEGQSSASVSAAAAAASQLEMREDDAKQQVASL